LAYRIAFKNSVTRDIKKLDIREAERVLGLIAEELPELADSLPELKGNFSGFRKYRIGEYRVIFTILNDSVLITRIRHRREVYKY
jgi:mRNA interferase RelE/StbE